MTPTRAVCMYCYEPRQFSTGWHDCSQARAAKKRLETAVEGIIGIGTGLDRKKKLITK